MRDRAKDSSPVDRPSSFVSLLSGWAQQGVESVLATRRILVDVASRQSAAAVKTLREGLSDPKHSARTILTDLVVEGTANFIEAQRILLTLAQEENKIVMTDVEERIGGYPAAAAIANRLHHAVDAFVEMQQGLLTIASKQSQHWLQPKEKGKRQEHNPLVNAAREAMETFASAQRKFLNVIAREPAKVPTGKAKEKTELLKLARAATDAFLDAQKKLLDLAGQEMNVNLQAAGRVKQMLKSLRLMPIAQLTTDGVKDFVDAEKALITSLGKGKEPKAAPKRKHSPQPKAVQQKAAAAPPA